MSADVPPQFAPLVADRRGDVLLAQGKKAQAIDEYKMSYKAFDANEPYRRLIQVKLNALGVDPSAEATKKEVKL